MEAGQKIVCSSQAVVFTLVNCCKDNLKLQEPVIQDKPKDHELLCLLPCLVEGMSPFAFNAIFTKTTNEYGLQNQFCTAIFYRVFKPIKTFQTITSSNRLAGLFRYHKLVLEQEILLSCYFTYFTSKLLLLELNKVHHPNQTRNLIKDGQRYKVQHNSATTMLWSKNQSLQ